MFTDKGIAAMAVRAHKYVVYEGGSDPGFCIGISPGGTKTFYQQYTADGQRRFLRLGTWPDLTLARARKMARDARQKIEAGEDVQGHPTRKQQDQAGTVAALLQAFSDRQQQAGRSYVANMRASIEKDAIPLIGDKPAAAVTPADIRQILFRVISRGAPVQANRLRSYLHAMFRYAIHHDNDPLSLGASVLFGMASNPVSDVPKNAGAEHPGERVLNWDELRAAWLAEGMQAPYTTMLRLIIATGGQRSSEIIGAARAEIEGDRWMIPAARSKNGRDHLIPITPLVREQIEEARRLLGGKDWLFPSRAVRDRPIQAQSLSRIVQEWCEHAGIQPWTPRDLRRTCKTRMGEIGISKFDRDRIQNHAIADVSGMHYDRWSYETEKRAGLTTWEARLRELLTD